MRILKVQVLVFVATDSKLYSSDYGVYPTIRHDKIDKALLKESVFGLENILEDINRQIATDESGSWHLVAKKDSSKNGF